MSYFDESDIPAGYHDADLETIELEQIGRQLAALDAVLPVVVEHSGPIPPVNDDHPDNDLSDEEPLRIWRLDLTGAEVLILERLVKTLEADGLYSPARRGANAKVRNKAADVRRERPW